MRYRSLLTLVFILFLSFFAAGQVSRGPVTALAASQGYHTVMDDVESMTMDVPTQWDEIEAGPWILQGKEVGTFIAASSNLKNFYDTKKEGGVFFGVSEELAHAYDPKQLLELQQREFGRKCKFDAGLDYRDAFYSGRTDSYVTCLKDKHKLIIAAVMPAHRSYIILLRIVLAKDTDRAAVTRIFETFQVMGAPGKHEH